MPDKKGILARLHQKAAAGVPIIGTGAGTGLTAKAEAEGDADLIIAYATGSFRMAGRSSLEGRFAASDANAAVLHMMDEFIPVAGDTPVLGGVFVRVPALVPPGEQPRVGERRPLRDHAGRGLLLLQAQEAGSRVGVEGGGDV